MTMVLLAHAHPAVRAWVRDALAQTQGVEFVAEATNGEEAARLLQQVRWDVALISCSLLHGMYAEGVELAGLAGDDARMVVLGAPGQDGLLYRLWRAGTLGCIAEDATPEVIVKAVQAAAHGRRLWTEDQIAHAQHWWDEVGCRLETLTERERHVLALLAQGLSNRQIAEREALSVNTVRTHVRNVLSKLVVSSRLEAAMLLAKGTRVNRTTGRIILLDDDKLPAHVIR